MPNLSLRTRLIAGMAVVAVVLGIVSFAVTATTRGLLMDQVDARLEAAAPVGAFGQGDFGERPAPPPQSGGAPRPFDERVSDVYQGVLTADGELVTIFTPNLGGVDYPPPDIGTDDIPADGSSGFATVTTDGVTYRVLFRPAGAAVSITAIPIDDVEDTIRQLVVVEVVGSLAILAALGLVSWWVVHLGIRPVKEMTTAATRIAAGQTGDRIPVTSPGTESGELATALNGMLERIQGALDERTASEERLRQFVADASHELRTPVTTIRGYAELYRHGGLADPGALDDAMRRTEQESERLGRLVEDMLTLARLDEQRPLARDPVDLERLVRDAVADARAVDPQRTIALDHDGSTLWTVGDADRLRQVLANVIGNALVHTPSDVPVRIGAYTRDDRAVVEVSDDGPGMEPDVAARATERFFRADPSRSRHRGGSGLGLSIVEAAVAAHGGDVDIDSAAGQGTTVRLSFPRRDRPA